MKVYRLSELLSSVAAPADRKSCLEFALAIELGYKVALPATKVESVVAYFEQFHAEAVKRVIGEVNELHPIAVQVCYNLTLDVFRTRYCICHDPKALSATQICSMLDNPLLATSVTDLHKSILKDNVHVNLLRSELSEFIGRHIVDRVVG